MGEKLKQKRHRRWRRQRHIRRKLSGTTVRPRMSVFRSSKHIYVQLVDDEQGQTIAASSTRSAAVRDQLDGATGNVAAAKLVGADIAARAKENGITKVAFDRGGFKYHGRVKALADAAREGGLEF